MDTQIAISVTDAMPGGALPSVRDVNCHLACLVCRGYLIDATTITECLHSFCRSCVIPHVNEHHTCPSCSVPLSTTKPFSQLRRDYTLQTIVYKMVPRLARSELERRQRFAGDGKSEPVADERYLESFIAPDDPISLSLEYAEPNCAFGLRRHRFGASLASESFDAKGDEGDHERRRYFRCPANLPVGHLAKFLRCKFNVPDANKHKLEVLYNGQMLAPEYKLADVAYIFSWKEMEPLRLWYRISSVAAPPSPVRPSGSAQSTQSTQQATATPKRRAERRAEKRVASKSGPLVDITSKRSWQSDANQRPAVKRRRKRAPAPATPPADEDDVKLSAMLAVPQTTAEQSLPQGASAEVNDATAADDDREAADNNNKTDVMFGDARSAEFTCSTPLPAPRAEEALEQSEAMKIKSTNWLPKAVFDLDDRDLFAKRLQKITKEEPSPRDVKAEAPPPPPEASPDTPPPREKREPVELSPSSPLDPLRICVTPEAPPESQAGTTSSEQVHDSIGALDLSGSSKSDSEVSPQPMPSPGTSSVNKSGPHPFFMTPMFQRTSTKSPSVPAKKPAPLFAAQPAGAVTKATTPTPTPPLWHLMSPHGAVPAADAAKPPSPHKALLEFFKSNPFLFRPSVSVGAPPSSARQAQKSPAIGKAAAKKMTGKLPSPKSI